MQDDVIRQPLLVEVAIEAASLTEREKLVAVLAKLAAEDAPFILLLDPGSGQTVLRGMSETHLERKIDLLVRAPGIAVNVGAWQVVISRASHHTGRGDFHSQEDLRSQRRVCCRQARRRTERSREGLSLRVKGR
ncbi:hypothetical protein JQ625_15595 [Bradyrhizobium diazoefficiens]|nr:hypothetical protein [Bradyrhizobium diazoefficiens]